jgi:hypothetical protein
MTGPVADSLIETFNNAIQQLQQLQVRGLNSCLSIMAFKNDFEVPPEIVASTLVERLGALYSILEVNE